MLFFQALGPVPHIARMFLADIGPWFERVATMRSASASLHPDCEPGGVRG